MRNVATPILLLYALVGCAGVGHQANSRQAVNAILMAGPGDVLLHVDRERNLENALGGADIFGRKTKEGTTELRFVGVDSDGTIVLYRQDIQIVTNETTMSRTPVATTTGRATTTGSGTVTPSGSRAQVNARSTTTYSGSTIRPASDFHLVIPSGATEIRLSPSERRLPIASFMVEIISASPNSLEYKVIRQQQ